MHRCIQGQHLLQRLDAVGLASRYQAITALPVPLIVR
jgi:hypothetical protein